jgi:hypothetical protein
MSENDRAIVITGEDNIEAARLLALRGSLRLEVRGLSKSGRSARTIAAEFLGLDVPKAPGRPGRRPNAATVYKALDAYLVRTYPGRIESRPLS